MLYVVIAADAAPAATKIALVRDSFETRLMSESFSTRPKAALLIVTVEVRRGRGADARCIERSFQAPKRSKPPGRRVTEHSRLRT